MIFPEICDKDMGMAVSFLCDFSELLLCDGFRGYIPADDDIADQIPVHDVLLFREQRKFDRKIPGFLPVDANDVAVQHIYAHICMGGSLLPGDFHSVILPDQVIERIALFGKRRLSDGFCHAGENSVPAGFCIRIAWT